MQKALRAPVGLIQQPMLLTYWFAYILNLWILRHLDEESMVNDVPVW